jgi:DNA-binding transcriptional MerR regulator
MTDRDTAGLSLAELSERGDVTPRTVRYYIQQGLLPSPGSGPKARYDERHVKRLRLVRELQRQHLPLAEIRARLDELDDEGVDRVLARRPEPAGSAIDYIRGVLGEAPHPAPASHVGPPHVASSHVAPSGAAPLPAPPALGKPPGRSLARSSWERIPLHQDNELHIRRPLTRHQNRHVERLVAFARQLLEEDQP